VLARLVLLGAVVTSAGMASCGGADAPPPESLILWVLEEPLTPDAAPTPLANATVVYGATTETSPPRATTAADGSTRITRDFAAGAVFVTAISPEHTVVSMLEVSPENVRAHPNGYGKPAGDLVVVLPRTDRAIGAATLGVRGTLDRRHAPRTTVDLAASGIRRGGAAVTTGRDYAFRAARARPFFVLGHEYREAPLPQAAVRANEHFGAFRFDFGAREDDVTQSVDLSAVTPLPTREIRLRVNGPDVSFGDAAATIESMDSGLLAGLVTRSEATTGGAFDLRLVVAETDFGAERLATRVVLSRADGSRSIRTEPGVGSDGASIGDFLAPPTVVERSRSLADPIDVRDFPSGADLRVEVYAGNQLFWIMRAPAWGLRGTTLSLPPPLGVEFNADVQVFALSLAAEQDAVPLPPYGSAHRRVAVSADVLVRRR